MVHSKFCIKISEKIFFIDYLIDRIQKIQLFSSITKEKKLNTSEYAHKIIWILHNFIVFFFDNEELAFKFEHFKPIKIFLILFYVCEKETKYKIKYIVSVHNYLAKYDP
jgi:hypothetical protein